MIIVNDFQPLPIVKKKCVFNVAGLLDLALHCNKLPLWPIKSSRLVQKNSAISNLVLSTLSKVFEKSRDASPVESVGIKLSGLQPQRN